MVWKYVQYLVFINVVCFGLMDVPRTWYGIYGKVMNVLVLRHWFGYKVLTVIWILYEWFGFWAFHCYRVIHECKNKINITY